MTSRRQRKINRDNSAAGILKRVREDDWTRQPDAARWQPGIYGDASLRPGAHEQRRTNTATSAGDGS